MKLVMSIILAGLLGLLIFFGPVGIYIICAIVVGVIFRSFVLLKEIHKQIVPIEEVTKADEVYEKYIRERNERERKEGCEER